MPRTFLDFFPSALLASALLATAPASASKIVLLSGSSISSESAAGASYPAAISSDGRYVLIASSASNLLPLVTDTNGAQDLFLLDRQAGSKTLITHAAGLPTVTADQGSLAGAMSPDGEWVLFSSWAGNLVAGLVRLDTSSTDVYLWRRSTGGIILVSHSAGQPLEATGGSRAIAVTPNGAFALFESVKTNLVAGITDSNNDTDVFRFTRASGLNQLASLASGGTSTGNQASQAVAIRADGGEVVFNSRSTNISGGSGRWCIFVRTFVGATITRIPLGLNVDNNAVAWTPEGRYVLLDNGGWPLIYDRTTSTARLISVFVAGLAVAMAADGGNAMFDYNGQSYLQVLGEGGPRCLSCGDGIGVGKSLSADGRWAIYESASGFHIYDASLAVDLPLLAGVTAGANFVGLTADGQEAFFDSAEAGIDPATDDRNGNIDAFAIEVGAANGTLLSTSVSTAAVPTTLANYSELTGLTTYGSQVLFRGPAYLHDPQNPDPDLAAWAYDLEHGSRRLLSPLPGQPTVAAGGSSSPLALAGDGRAVLSSSSPDLVPGTTLGFYPQLFLYSPQMQEYRMVSRKAADPLRGTDGQIGSVKVDPGLTKAFFLSDVADIVAGASVNFRPNLFSCNLLAPGCTLLSRDSANANLGASSELAYLEATPDLSVAVFSTSAGNLVPGATSGTITNLFAWRQAGGISLLSRSSQAPAQEANSSTVAEAISADGRFVLASAFASNLDADAVDLNGRWDVYLLDTLTATWELISSSALDPNTATTTGDSFGLGVSNDGRFVLFYSSAVDLVAGQIEQPGPIPVWGERDLFVVDRSSGQRYLVSHLPGQPLQALGYSQIAQLAPGGRRVVFLNASPSLMNQGAQSLYRWELDAGAEVYPLVLARGGPYAFSAATPAETAFDGNVATVFSSNDNLTPGDSNTFQDVYAVLIDALFFDGFEAGNTSAWSSTVP